MNWPAAAMSSESAVPSHIRSRWSLEPYDGRVAEGLYRRFLEGGTTSLLVTTALVLVAGSAVLGARNTDVEIRGPHSSIQAGILIAIVALLPALGVVWCVSRSRRGGRTLSATVRLGAVVGLLIGIPVAVGMAIGAAY